MNPRAGQIKKPRCFLLYATAPDDLPASEANRILNQMVADPSLPLALFHDHFIGQPGGVAVFNIQSTEERDALLSQKHLAGWRVEIQPLVFSYSPSAFDEQIAFTIKAYRNLDWDILRREKRPSFGNPIHEAETAQEDPE